MKLLTSYHSSSSPSSSSSSTLSLDPTLCNSNSATTTAGCLTAILRRILCSGGLPTHPSDQIRELDSMLSGKDKESKDKHENTEAATRSSATATLSAPTIVAKLMGLEANIEMPSKATVSSLSRSQSMNSVDYLGECKKPKKGLHRRVKSSSSFCEALTFRLHENENFLELSFESGCERKEFKSKGRRKDSGSAELKKKRELKEKNKREKVHEENGGVEKGDLSKRVTDLSSVIVGKDGEFQSIGSTLSMNMVSSEKEYSDSEVVKVSQPLKLKEVANGEKAKRRKKGKRCRTEKKVESECSSEDSSPVSVFDFEREALETEVDSLGVDLSWRRQLSPELENELLFVLHSDSNLMVEERQVKAIENNKKKRLKKKEKQSQECADIWGEICMLVENYLVGSNQVEAAGMRKQGDFDSISADVESEIYDHLLNELIDQLVFSN